MTYTRYLAVTCVGLLLAQRPYLLAQEPQSPANPAQLTPEQLESLVAPIALYPDPILSQMLVASTYPLEIVEAGRWLKEHSNLTGKALTDAAAQQNWDASVQALVILPDALKRLDENVSWTSDLGNAFLAQQQGVMDAVQRMRQRAEQRQTLQTTPQQTVSTVSNNGQTYIQIEPASPQVVYIPQYNPVAAYGPSPDSYPYPPIYYPPAPSYGSLAAASVISFGTGLAVGAIWGGGWNNWGWNTGWGRNNVIINNNFINRNRFNRVNVANGNNWVHNPAHRGGVPYSNRNVANRFGGQFNTNVSRPTANQVPQRFGNNPNFTRPNAGQIQQRLGQMNPGFRGQGMPGQGAMPAQGAFGQHQGGASRISPGAFGSGGGERIGNRSVQAGGGFSGGAFGGMSQGGARTRMNMDRGFGSRGFGGGGRGFGGGGRRFGGGRRR